jgi:hypothetical protein
MASREVQYISPEGRIVSRDEAFEAGGRVMKPGYILRRPMVLMDSQGANGGRERDIFGPSPPEREAMKRHLETAYRETK